MMLATLSREELIDRVTYLESEVGLSRCETEIAMVGRSLGLTRQQTRILLALTMVKGRVLAYLQIIDAIESIGQDRNTVSVQMVAIRRRFREIGLTDNIFKTHAGVGYSATNEAIEIVERAKLQEKLS